MPSTVRLVQSASHCMQQMIQCNYNKLIIMDVKVFMTSPIGFLCVEMHFVAGYVAIFLPFHSSFNKKLVNHIYHEYFFFTK